MRDGSIPGRSDRILFDYISSCLILLIVRADCIIDEALAHYSVSREDPGSVMKCETVLG